MDTSKEYIKMCEESQEYLFSLAPEIRCGTVVVFSDGEMRIILSETEINYAEKIYEYIVLNPETHQVFISQNILDDGCVLWQQDQLQEMVAGLIDDEEIPHHLLSNTLFYLSEFLRPIFLDGCSTGKQLFNSMEQLWLAFIMKEKFNKLWNGEEWKG